MDETVNILSRIGATGFTALLARKEKTLVTLSEDELAAVQSRRLQALVRHAWLHVPHYRESMHAAGMTPDDVRTAADLQALPLVDKLALTLEPERFAAEGYENRDGLTLLSSGTSGRRRRFRYDALALFEALAAGRRQRIALKRFVGRESGYREAVVNREGNAGAQIRQFWESRLLPFRGVELTRARFSPSLPFAALLSSLNEFKPEVIRGLGHTWARFSAGLRKPAVQLKNRRRWCMARTPCRRAIAW